MDIVTLITSITSSLGISVVAAWKLSDKLVTHRLSKDLEKYKVEWQKELEKEKAKLQAEMRKESEIYIGDKAAEREYKFDALKRLYNATGSLRFQLLVACREASTRIESHCYREAFPISLERDRYYGRSTLYRLLRPIAISELIERQMAYADFSVDPAAIDLLLFKKSVFMALTGGEIANKHPNLNWQEQREHSFYDNLSRSATALIVNNDGKERVMHFHEFDSFLQNPDNLKRIAPLPRLFTDFTMASKPIWGLRLISFGYICNEFLKSEGKEIKFGHRPYIVKKMLGSTKDNYILSRIEEYEELIYKSKKAKL